MTIERLRGYPLVYLATPYSKFPHGIEVAFREAAALAARLMLADVKVYSPIAHTHPLAVHGHIDPMNHDVWLPFDEAIMAKSDALLVAKMATWDISYGIAHEIGVFKLARKPIHYLNPESMVVE